MACLVEIFIDSLCAAYMADRRQKYQRLGGTHPCEATRNVELSENNPKLTGCTGLFRKIAIFAALNRRSRIAVSVASEYWRSNRGERRSRMMTRNTMAMLALCVLALGMTGCQSSRFPQMSSRAEVPAPLPPAPAGNVQASQLPPPGGFPEMPEQGTSIADLEVAAASAPEVSQTGVVGSWKTAASGVNCQMFLTLTKYGANSRGGTRGCPGELAGMRSWNVSGKQLQIYDENGSQIATLFSTGAERFDGQTSGGESVSLSR